MTNHSAGVAPKMENVHPLSSTHNFGLGRKETFRLFHRRVSAGGWKNSAGERLCPDKHNKNCVKTRDINHKVCSISFSKITPRTTPRRVIKQKEILNQFVKSSLRGFLSQFPIHPADAF
jgi:hypothetical protein